MGISKAVTLWYVEACQPGQTRPSIILRPKGTKTYKRLRYNKEALNNVKCIHHLTLFLFYQLMLYT